jgi:hypothetical protein
MAHALLAALAVAASMLVAGPLAGAGAADAPTYLNPVSKTFADTFADPSLMRGKDGWWYA